MNRRLAVDLVLTLAPAAAVLAAIAIAAIIWSPAEIPRFTRDVFVIGKFNSLTGGLSNAGAFLWFGTASVLAFAAAQSWRLPGRPHALFLAMGALFTWYLWFDDFFMFHEALAPHLLGIDELFVYVTLGLAGLVYLFGFRAEIYATRYLWLVASVGCLGLSVSSDLVMEWLDREPGGWWFLLEDGLKWFGIVLWARYQVGTAYGCVVSRQP